MNDLVSIDSILPTIISDLDKVEDLLLSQPQCDCPLRHIFGPGLYIREVTLPKNAWALGAWQNYAQMNIMIAGQVQMFNDDGTTAILTAPMTFVGPPGRKLGFVIEECVWQNVYATNETDIEKLELFYLTKSESSEEEKKIILESKRLFYDADRFDFDLMLNELGVTAEQVEKESHDMSDSIELPLANYKFQSADSPIQGKGVFATSHIDSGEVIGPARLNNKRTILGRGINHSADPNCIVVRSGNDLWIKAISDLTGMKSSFLGDEITIDYRQAMQINKMINTEKELLCQE